MFGKVKEFVNTLGAQMMRSYMLNKSSVPVECRLAIPQGSAQLQEKIRNKDKENVVKYTEKQYQIQSLTDLLSSD